MTKENKMIQNNKALTPLDAVRKDFAAVMPKFRSALPPNITTEKFLSVVMTALQRNPDMLGVDRQSLINAAITCANDGLLPDGREAALVKYGNKAQYLPMVGGIYKKLRASGEVISLTSQVIYEKDKFRYWVDSDGEHLEHEPLLFGDDRGERIGVYALAKLKNGAIEIEPMTKKDVYSVKGASKSASNGPWAGPFENEMWRKTAVRRLSKRLPLTKEAQDVLSRDDEVYDFKEAAQNETREKTNSILDMINAPEPKEERVVEVEAGVIVKGESNDPTAFENYK